MTSNITLEEFKVTAKKWLDENAQKKPDTSEKEAEWGEGEFSVAVFHNLTFEEERDLLPVSYTHLTLPTILLV